MVGINGGEDRLGLNVGFYVIMVGINGGEDGSLKKKRSQGF